MNNIFRIISNIIANLYLSIKVFVKTLLADPIHHKKQIVLEKQVDQIVDLNPILQYMDEYVGNIIVSVDGFYNYDDVCTRAQAKIVNKVQIENNGIKFELSDIKGKNKGSLIIIPSKNGLFKERDSEESLDVNSIYRINFYGGFCLEYLDSKGLGEIIYLE